MSIITFICDNSVTTQNLWLSFFSGEQFKDFEVLLIAMSAKTTQLLSSGEFCKPLYDTIPFQNAFSNVSFYTNNSKNAKFWIVTLLSQMSDIICWCETNKSFSFLPSPNLWIQNALPLLFNPLAPELFFFKFQHILYIKCE